MGVIALTIVAMLVGPTTALAAPSDPSPPTSEASEDPLAGVACPQVGSLAPLLRNVRLDDDGGALECRYVTDGTNAYNITVAWVRVGGPPGRHCSKSAGDVDITGEEAGNSIYQVRSGATSTQASVNISKEGAIEAPSVWVDAATALLPQVEVIAEPCAPEYPCTPALGGLLFDDWRETGIAQQFVDGGTTEISCAYVPPDDDTELTRARLAVFSASPQSPDSSKITQCSAIDEFEAGFVHVDGPGDLAIRGVIDLAVPSLRYDIDALRAELDAMIATFAPTAATCDGVPDAELYSPLPQWLADVWDESYTSGVPTLVLTEGGAESLVSPPPVTAPDVPATTVEPVALPTTVEPVTEPAAVESDEAATAPTSDPGVSEPAASSTTAAGGAPSASSRFPGWAQTAMRVFGWIALPLSIIGVALALFMLKRESRVRPKLDVIRIVIMVVVAAVTTLVLGRSTPLWVFPVAIGIGAALGVVQGRNLDVRVANDRLMATRSRAAMIAFVIGLACSQLSGLLGRVGVLSVGVGITMLSAALAAGITIGRSPKVRHARASIATTMVLLFASAPVLAMIAGGAGPAVDVALADESSAPAEEEPPPEPAETAEEYLDGLVDWTTLQLASGYDGVGTGKPLVEVTLPVGLATVPDPIEVTSTWSLPWNQTTYSYDLDETYTLTALPDGLCCAVSYAATGTQQTGEDRPVEAITAQADLGAITSMASGFNRSAPFGAAELLDDETCGRQVLRTRSLGDGEPSWSVLTVGDSSVTNRQVPEVSVYTECDLPGFTVSAALDRAPTVPSIDDPRRIDNNGTVCPVHQEVMATFGRAPRYADQAATPDLLDLFREPNAPRCSGSAYVGDERKGGMRNEFQFQLASVNPETESQRQRAIAETFGDRRLPHEISADLQCDVATNGVPQNRVDQDFCLSRTYHEFGDGEITIWTNTDLADGPDTIIRGNFPWGSYFYNCHHCEVGDPYIADVLNTWHRFAQEWNSNGVAPSAADDAEFAEPSDERDDTDRPDDPATPAVDIDDGGEPAPLDADGDIESATDEGAERDGGEDEADSSSDDGVDPEDVAAIALVSLLGAAGLAGTTVAESGHSMSELLDAYRDGGRERVESLLDTDLAPVESPDDPVRGWDPDREEFRDMTRAERDRLEGVDRAQRRADRLERDAELLADIRADRARVDRLTDELRRRDELEALLAAAEADQERWSDPAHVRQAILDDAFDGMLRDIEGLPGELREVAQAVNETLNDPETWEVLGETMSGTAADVAGMLSPVEFGDGRRHLTESTQALGRFGAAMAEAFARDPVGFAMQMSPLQDVQDSLDGDRTLGERFASLGMVLAELFPAMGGASLARDASNLVDASRDLERTADAARSSRRLGDVAEAGAGGDRTLGRLSDARRDAALAESLDDVAHAAPRTGGVVDDIEAQIARNRAALADDLGSPAEQARRAAWEANQRTGAAAVDDFARHATRPVDLDVESVAELSAAQREAALRVQTNKNGLQQIKNQPEEVQRVFVNQMREIYDETDAAVLDWATDYINNQQSGRLRGVQIQGDLRLDRVEAGRHVFVDEIGNEIQLFEPTNARAGEISVGADRDFTAYVKPAGSDAPAFSLPRDDVRPVYNDAFYEAIGGDEMRERLGIPAVTSDEVLADALRRDVDPPADPVEAARRQTVDRVAERLDQAVTDDLDPEAYRNVRTVIHRPFSEIGDSQQVGLTMTHKGEEWQWRADHSGDRAIRPTASGDAGGGISWAELSEDQRAEGVRQIVKQNGKQVRPRLDALQRQTQYLIDTGQLPPGTPIPQPDTRLDRAMAIMETIKEEGVSPVDMERRLLAETGMTPSHVANAAGERIRLMEHLRPPEVRELQQRMDRIADQLVRDLKDLPDPGDRIPTSDQVWERLILDDGPTSGAVS